MSASDRIQRTKPPIRRVRKLRVAAVLRWLHIYVSMIGFSALLFFAWTGITLNHPTWFGASDARTRELSGNLSNELKTEQLSTGNIDQLAVAEALRATHGLRGKVSRIDIAEDEIFILFKGPGYSADVLLDARNGEYSIVESSYGLAGILNDLHKGRDAGRVWSVAIDISAYVMIAFSLTGFGLLFFLKRRRTSGAAVAVVATIGLGVISVWCAV